MDEVASAAKPASEPAVDDTDGEDQELPLAPLVPKLGSPAASAPPPTTAESAEPSEVVAATDDVVETETPIEAELAEPAPVEEVSKSDLDRLLMRLYGYGPELLIQLARQRETWYYVAGGVGVVLGVVLLWLAVKSVFFGPPNLHYQFTRNALVEPVQILVDGQVVRTLQPGQQDSMVLPKGRPIEVSWRLIRPRQGREQMGQEFSAVLSTGTRRGKDTHSVITGVTPDRAMFAPRITNRTNRELVALINPGTPAETRCNCVIPSSSRDLHVGYYPLLENSTIQFFDARRAYSGRYQEIGDISGRVDTLSGSVGLTVATR